MSPENSYSTSTEPDAPVRVFRGEPVRVVSRELSSNFASMAVELLGATDHDLRDRLKEYDNHDRFTLGRAMTPALDRRALTSNRLTPDIFQEIRPKDPSAFASGLSVRRYAGVWTTLRESLEALCADLPPDDQVFVSIYCHRVLVRPGDSYQGFFHRDNKPGEKCGTCVSYPRVDAGKLRGAAVFCRWRDDGDPRGREQKMILPSSMYAGARLLMRYPHNLAHGVTTGRHRLPAEPGRKVSVRDFLNPAHDDFVKDLMIVTISEAPNAEE